MEEVGDTQWLCTDGIRRNAVGTLGDAAATLQGDWIPIDMIG